MLARYGFEDVCLLGEAHLYAEAEGTSPEDLREKEQPYCNTLAQSDAMYGWR